MWISLFPWILSRDAHKPECPNSFVFILCLCLCGSLGVCGEGSRDSGTKGWEFSHLGAVRHGAVPLLV